MDKTERDMFGDELVDQGKREDPNFKEHEDNTVRGYLRGWQKSSGRQNIGKAIISNNIEDFNPNNSKNKFLAKVLKLLI